MAAWVMIGVPTSAGAHHAGLERTHPVFAGMVLTEVNPTHDADGSQLDRYVGAITEILATA